MQRGRRHNLRIDSHLHQAPILSPDTTFHLNTQHELPGPDMTAAKAAQPCTEPLYFSFSGGGWLMVYMYGVCKALREQKVDENAKFIGTSAGCLSIVSLVLNSDFDEICDSVVNDYVPPARASWRGPFQMRDYLVDAVKRHGNVDNMHKLHGKVTIVYTSLSAWVTRRVSHFKNPLHLLQTMIASCCATPLVGLPFEHEGEYVIDGGLLDNQPLFGDGVCTITVTPNVFADAADIRPSRYVPPWWSMYPPSQREMWWLYGLGYADGLSWCVRQGLPGSESIVVPTKAAEFKGEWKMIVGQLVGYRSVEDAVLAVAELLMLSEETITSNVIQLEIVLWRLVAVVAALLDWTTVFWAVLAAATLVGLTLLDQQFTLEFVVVLGSYLAVAVLKLKEVCWQVHSSSHWHELRLCLAAMETTCKVGLTLQQEALLAKWSFAFRFSSLLE
ncbi:unnamed protein product [Phytophthora fragariaefolia]|uniref:Unnamed protein product n=1 Tax=Phytophthora fragariaefolia TaxID=1490495 RepID=A0A9W7D2Q1_9STRA|nr:unnamed protein product [Phytophthora fragariaefolia]